jgi:hypothetical protein
MVVSLTKTGEKQMLKKQRILLIGLTLMIGLWCHAGYARTYNFKIYANSDDFVANVESESLVSEAVLTLGGGVAFSENDYRMGNIHFALKDEVFMPALALGLGFKGILGTAEVDHNDYDVIAIGFMLLGEYDFRKIYYNLPVLLYSSFTGSPSPLSFGDTDTYLEFNVGIKGYIVKNAAIVFGYKALEVRFDDAPDENKLKDDAFYFGVELSF